MAPADLHEPFSIHNDTSIYHRPSLSSRPNYQDLVNSIPNSQIQSPTVSTFSSRTHRERLNDPTASGLDLDDDSRSSVASDTFDGDSQLAVSDDDDVKRMSYLGPKMRFHSRAPWEIDQDTIEEDDQQSDQNNVSIGTRKAFGLSSPRPNNLRRPSVESTRSQPKSKQSFETTSSNFSYPRGALYALAQESLSASSLGPPPSSQKGIRGKFSFSRMRSESPSRSLLPSPVSSARSSDSSPWNYHSPRQESTDTQTSFQNQTTYDNDNFHPYANPDLVISFEDQLQHLSSESIVHSGSVSTITDSTVPIPLSRSETNSTLSPSTSITSTPVVNNKSRPSLIQGKGISLPILNTNHGLDAHSHPREDYPTSRQSGVDNFPGWIDRTSNPGFSLISLEEARAQRIRSKTVQLGVTRQPPPLATDLSLDAEKRGSIDNNSPRPQRARARSISGATKAKTALHTIVGGGQSGGDRRDPDPVLPGSSGKTLKHRKSGFMRLFNASRGQEKDDKPQPPPVPPIPDAQSEPEAPKSAISRVPVPDLPLSPVFPPEPSSSAEPSPTLGSPSATTCSPTPKRLHPPLSINTQARSHSNHILGTVENGPPIETQAVTAAFTPAKPWLISSVPKSAPADVSEFPSLKLRPVSTLFSAHFEDHIFPSDSRPSLETDVGTPSSSTKVHSPVTPGSAFRADLSTHDKIPTFTPTVSENQASVISALQDQFSSSKIAWQRRIQELEGQVRDLKLQLESLRRAEIDSDYCERCGRGQPPSSATSSTQDGGFGVLNRPRARTGTTSRFGSAV